MIQAKMISHYLSRWQDILRLRDWDIQLQIVDVEWRKTGDIKIDADNKKAVLMVNGVNPRQENLEEVVIHELIHLKLWGLDQMLEQLLTGLFGKDENDPRYEFANTQFMMLLETTVEDLAKGYLALGGQNKTLSLGRLRQLAADEVKENNGVRK